MMSTLQGKNVFPRASNKKKVKVSHSLIAVGAVGVKSPTVSLAQQMRGRAHLSPFAALAFPISKKVSIYSVLTERDFQSSHGEAQSQTHALRRRSAL